MNKQQYSESSSIPQVGKRPNTFTQRSNNATRLAALRRRCPDIEAILDRVPARCGDGEVRRVVTLLAAEIAILADPVAPERVFWSEAAAFLARLFGPEAAVDLWTRHAEKPMADHLARVKNAQEALERDHQARIRPDKLVADKALSTALGFTFWHRTAWFGGKCALVPVAENPRDKEVHARLREVAKLNGLRPERVRDAYREGGMAGVEILLEKLKAQPAPLWEGRPKRGRPVTGKVRVAVRVAKIMEQTGRSRSHILDVYAVVRQHDPDLDEEGTWRMVLRSLRVNALRHPRDRKGKDAVVAHHTHRYGKAPSASQISKWISRGTFMKRVNAAETWIALSTISSRDVAEVAKVVGDETHLFRETSHAGTARSVRAAEADSDARSETTDDDAQGPAVRG